MQTKEQSAVQRLIDEAKHLGCPERECPICKARSGFRRHDSRKRLVHSMVDNVVTTCVIVLLRWKCCSCGRTFTHYPEFLLPYKRYVLGAILDFAQRYVNSPEASCRAAVHSDAGALGYTETEEGGIDERQMSHTTLWRWLACLGAMTALADQGMDLLRQKDPHFELHRAVTMFPAKNYRSKSRKNLLQQAASLLQVARDFRRLFSSRLFPTLCNSPAFNTG
jgi:hypothetical protein